MKTPRLHNYSEEEQRCCWTTSLSCWLPMGLPWKEDSIILNKHLAFVYNYPRGLLRHVSCCMSLSDEKRPRGEDEKQWETLALDHHHQPRELPRWISFARLLQSSDFAVCREWVKRHRPLSSSPSSPSSSKSPRSTRRRMLSWPRVHDCQHKLNNTHYINYSGHSRNLIRGERRRQRE